MHKFVVALAGLLVTLAVPTAAVSATISALPPAQQIGIGDSTQVNVRISGLGDFTAPTLGAYRFTVSYDDSIVALDSVSFSTWLGTSLQFETPAADSINLTEVSLASTGFLDSLQPEAFLLATLYFDGIGLGTSPIDFSSVDLSDADGNTISGVSLNPGSITVVPLPAAAWLFGSALLGLVGMGWRRRAA